MCQCINKLILFIVNAVFLLLGITVVGVSLWVILSHDTLFKLIQLSIKDKDVDDTTLKNYMDSTSMLITAAWILLAFGVISLLIGFCGCVGTTCENVTLLVVYSVVIIIIVIAEVAGVITAVVFSSQLGDNLKPRLRSLVAKRFLPWPQAIDKANANKANGMFTASINYAQVSLQCCGIEDITDIIGPNTTWTRANATYMNSTLKVPVTCCPINSNRQQLLSKQDWKNIQNYLTNKNCPRNGADVNRGGCYDKLISIMKNYTRPLIIVGVLVVICELLCVVMAISMVQKIRNEQREI